MRILFVILLLLPFYGQAQTETIKWLSIEEADRLNQENPKPLLIDFYTDWCGWCKHMDKTTYVDRTVISLINRNFYPVKINAESADTLRYKGKIYAPMKHGSKSLSTLAVEVLGGKMSYPSTAFIYDKEKINMVVPGYLDVVKMQAILIFFTENAYSNININHFIDDFEAVFKTKEGEDQDEPAVTYWTSFSELESKQKEKPKKVLLYMSATWNNTSKMMEKNVFADTTFSALANKYFYSVHLDVQDKANINFMGHQFSNSGSDNNNLHQLAIALSDKLVRVPSLYIFDEDGKLMERLYFYQNKKTAAMILDFIGSNAYQTMPWADFMKVKEIEGF